MDQNSKKILGIVGFVVVVIFIILLTIKIKSDRNTASPLGAVDSTSPDQIIKDLERQNEKNLTQEKSYTPHPAVVVFSKDSKLDARTQEDIRQQIKKQTSKPIKIPNDSKKETSPSTQKSTTGTSKLPSRLHIIEGQLSFSFIGNSGSPINWFKIGDKSYGSSNGTNWLVESNNKYSNPLLGRYSFPSTFLNNKIYIASGWNGFWVGCGGDVWHSTNGKGWLNDTRMAPWVTSGKITDGRFEHTLTTHNSKMYLMGGSTCYNNLQPGDVWSSADGSNWNQLTTSNAVLGNRLGHTTISFKGKLFTIGGFTMPNDGFVNDVVSSSDGINWQTETSSAPWSPRGDHSAFVFNNKMWVAGGHYQGWPDLGIEIIGDTAVQYLISINGGPSILSTLEYYSDVWSSSDGKTWTHYLSDVITSIDGKNWTKISDLVDPGEADPIRIAEHASVVAPANFGSTIPYHPPTVDYISSTYNGTSSIDLFTNISSNDPQTTAWFDYENYTPPLNWALFAISGGSNSSTPSSVSSGLLTQNIPITNNNSPVVVKTIVKNSAGEKNFINPYVYPCSPTSGPSIGLKPINNGDPLVAGQSYLLEWTTCNISSTSNLINAAALDVNVGGYWQYFNLLNDGSELVTIPANFTSGTHYRYVMHYYDPVIGSGAAAYIPIVIQ